MTGHCGKVGESVGVDVKEVKFHEGEELELRIFKSYLELVVEKACVKVCVKSSQHMSYLLQLFVIPSSTLTSSIVSADRIKMFLMGLLQSLKPPRSYLARFEELHSH